jgi:hypothetical protein
LDLDVIPTDSLVIQLNEISLFTTNRDRCSQIIENSAAVGTLKHSQDNRLHGQTAPLKLSTSNAGGFPQNRSLIVKEIWTKCN